jgi:very-short-patch-repair endonuclease
MERKYIKCDWKKIQKEYDKGLSCTDLIKKFGIAKNTLLYAQRRGDFKTRSRSEAMKVKLKNNPRTHDEKTKNKISKSRLKYLNEHPDEVPYLMNHSSKMSYPEIIFKDALEKNQIGGWIYNYQFGIYCFDFAFPDLKIDVEIDGETHLTDKVKKIDKRRDKNSVEKGWTVIRFTAKEVKSNVDQCIENLKVLIPS